MAAAATGAAVAETAETGSRLLPCNAVPGLVFSSIHLNATGLGRDGKPARSPAAFSVLPGGA